MNIYEPLLIFYQQSKKPFHQQPRLIREWIQRMERQACDQGYAFYRPY
jgi:hypothetical protein